VENPHTGERRGFASLRQLIVFLGEQAGETLIQSQQEEHNQEKEE
jgi:hypothetical protein